MSDRPEDIEGILTALEDRVTRAFERIRDLTAENRRLKAGQPVAAAHVGTGHDGTATAGLEERVRLLDRERNELLADRKALTQRVEEILTRLEYLESETVTH